MTFSDWIVVMVIVVILSLAIGYIIHAKRKGIKCIGCPDSKKCSAYKNGCCCNGKNDLNS